MPGESGFKWVYVTSHIDSVLQKIQSTGKPDKLTTTHLSKSWLLKDAKLGAVIDLLKDMGFLDDNGTPTEMYSAYQNESKSKKVLAHGIKLAYPKLFKDYPNAQSLDGKQLEGYIKEHTGADKSVVDKVKATFTKLCSLADFEGSIGIPVTADKDKVSTQAQSSSSQSAKLSSNLQMNFEIHIAADTPIDKIDAIFSSMRKHLFSNN